MIGILLILTSVALCFAAPLIESGHIRTTRQER